MVKIVRAPAGPEIITFRDLAGIKAAGTGGPLQQASSAVESLDKWISLADRGISMLGRVDSILGRVGTLKGGQQQQQAPPPQRLLDAPAGMMINKDLQQQPPGDPEQGPVQVLQRGPPPPVDVQQIIGALDMISKMQPGLTVQELSDTMKARPEEVQRILTVALIGGLPK
jgi:hypothetical protein